MQYRNAMENRDRARSDGQVEEKMLHLAWVLHDVLEDDCGEAGPCRPYHPARAEAAPQREKGIE